MCLRAGVGAPRPAKCNFAPKRVPKLELRHEGNDAVHQVRLPQRIASPMLDDMPISIDSVAQGTTTGVVGALVFWGFALLRDSSRNLLLRRAIRGELRFLSCGGGIQGLTTTVQNHLQKSFTVRAVVLVTDEAEYVFNATGKVESSIPSKPKFTKDEKARLKRGEAIPGKTQVQHRSWIVNPAHTGFVEVTPFTSQQFIIPAEIFATFNGKPNGLRTMVEYESWTGKVRILEQDSEGWAVENLKQTVAHFREEVLSGNLNKARMMFGFPPINLPTEETVPSSSG